MPKTGNKAYLLEPQAFELYRTGMTLTEIAKTVGVSLQTISGKKGWKVKYNWDQKIEKYETSSRSSVEIIKRIIKDKLDEVKNTPVKELPKGFEDGLFKLQLMAEKMDVNFDRLAFTLEIMKDYNEFLTYHHPELAVHFHELLPEFLNAQSKKYG